MWLIAQHREKKKEANIYPDCLPNRKLGIILVLLSNILLKTISYIKALSKSLQVYLHYNYFSGYHFHLNLQETEK